MIRVDAPIVVFLNGFASRSCVFDGAVLYVATTAMLKGVVLLAFVWGALNARAVPKERRDALLAVLVFSVPALFVSRALAAALPFRSRPLYDSSLNFQPACGLVVGEMQAWSSFPSDHAVLYAMLATGVWFASRRLGAAAMAYVVVFVLFPRLYLGLHWPTDVLAGAALGVAFAQLAARPWLRTWVARWCDALRERIPPGIFHACLFVCSYLLATHFDELRELGERTVAVLRFAAS
jgi:membrane-associated phospholipid phosphatase